MNQQNDNTLDLSTPAKKRRVKRKNLGLCVSCPNKNKDRSIYCTVCLQKRREYEKKRYQNRRAKGICGSCATGKAIPGVSLCEPCWWSQKSYQITGAAFNVEKIKQLWNQQNGKCALTGEPLILGHNASLDHIIPKCKGGISDTANLQWVLTPINSGKQDLTQEEFIRLCKLVAANYTT